MEEQRLSDAASPELLEALQSWAKTGEDPTQQNAAQNPSSSGTTPSSQPAAPKGARGNGDCPGARVLPVGDQARPLRHFFDVWQ